MFTLSLLTAMVVPSEGRIARRFKSSLDDYNFSDDVMEKISIVHGKYVKNHSHRLPDTHICVQRPNLRYEVLDLDIEEEDLKTYIEGMCPQLAGVERWIDEAMDTIVDYMSDPTVKMVSDLSSAVDSSKDLLSQSVDKAARVANAYGDRFGRAYNGLASVASNVGDVAGSVLASTAKAASEHMDENYRDKPLTWVEDLMTIGDEIANFVSPKPYYDKTVEFLNMTLTTARNESLTAEEMVKLMVSGGFGVARDAADATDVTYKALRSMIVEEHKRITDENYDVKQDAIEKVELLESVVKSLYGKTKDAVIEVDPIGKTLEIARVAPEITKIAGNTVQNLVVGATDQLPNPLSSLPTLKELRRDLIGEPVTSDERIARAGEKPHWTLGGLFTWRTPYVCEFCMIQTDEYEKKKGRG